MTLDIDYLQLAVELAERGQYSCQPNPMVGCVLVKDCEIIGEGWHAVAGKGHAEVNAITDAQTKGNSPNGATAYVSLEPCSHQGKTPPCVDALISAGIAKVVCATTDPNPEVSGQGLVKLNEAGIPAAITECKQTQQYAKHLNRAFFHRMRTGKPYVMLKVATTLDGRTADSQCISQWITGDAARQDVQYLRASSGAVLTGSGTQMADDPRLNVRVDDVEHQPLRVLLDTRLQIKTDANIIGDDKKLIVYTAEKDNEKIAQLQDHVHSIRNLDGAALVNVLNDLAELEINQVMVEAGATLAGAFLAEDLVDEIVHYLAPSVLGDQARAAFDFPVALSLQDKKRFNVHSCELIGDDIKITVLRHLI